MAATLYLQRRGRVTAAELAEHLEVSLATARRDLEALGAAGIPVYPQPGRRGGWQLVGGARTDLSGLSEPEVRALFLALGGLDGGAPAAGIALAKLVRALPEPFRDVAEVASSARRRDPSGWERPADEPPALLARLEDAVLRRRACEIGYRRRGSAGVRHVEVEPWRLVEKAGVVYLLAGTARGPRTYRVDRVVALMPLDRTIERPDDGELDRIWEETSDVVRAARTGVTARVRADPAALRVLADLFGSAFTPTEVEGEAVVAAHTERGLAEQLAGWGGRVRVLDAPGVVAELRAIGAELLAAYDDATTA